MGLLSKEFGVFSSKDVMDRKDGHLKNVGSWIGNMKFTKEEMAEMDAETASAVRQFAVDTLSENTERSKTRRDLAVITIQFYCLLLFMSVMLYPFNVDWSQFTFKIATETEVAWLVLGVGAFFWGSHTLRTANK